MSPVVKLVLYAIAPPIVAAATYPFWIISETRVIVSIFTMLLAFVVTPVYLLYMIRRFSSTNEVSLLFSIPMCFFANVLFVLAHYLNWGNSTGLLKTPDSSTILIVKLELFVSIAILIIGSFIISILRLRTK